MEQARSTLAPLERIISEMIPEIERLKNDKVTHELEFKNASEVAGNLLISQSDLLEAEQSLFGVRELENRQRMAIGAAQQKVDVLGILKTRKLQFTAERVAYAAQVARLKILERAFGKECYEKVPLSSKKKHPHRVSMGVDPVTDFFSFLIVDVPEPKMHSI